MEITTVCNLLDRHGEKGRPSKDPGHRGAAAELGWFVATVGPHKAVAERALPGIGVTLRGRFGGQLRLVCPGYAGEGVMGIFLEVPTGSHFTEVQVRSTYDHLPP